MCSVGLLVVVVVVVRRRNLRRSIFRSPSPAVTRSFFSFIHKRAKWRSLPHATFSRRSFLSPWISCCINVNREIGSRVISLRVLPPNTVVSIAFVQPMHAFRDGCPFSQRETRPLLFFLLLVRFAGVKEVASFATLPQSFASMMYVLMFSNWPMFMDAAGVVGNLAAAKVFFYSFKIIGFYFLMPVSLWTAAEYRYEYAALLGRNEMAHRVASTCVAHEQSRNAMIHRVDRVVEACEAHE